ncbi:MAG: T9SS type A sorting domain-containing protein [bacterium]|nr:T9SS type A sorting domain-containing protein [bacterium]
MKKYSKLVLFITLVAPLTAKAYISYNGMDSLHICEMKRNAYNRLMERNNGTDRAQSQTITPFSQAKGWDISILDSAIGSIVDETSLALDSFGNPCIVYKRGGDNLIYTSYNADSSKWVSDPRLGGAYPSLALDSLGYPHISCSFNGLGYIHKNIIGWDTIEVYPGPWVDWTSIALDSKGRPHIGWTLSAWSDADIVLYTYWNDTTWKTEIVDTVMGYSGGAWAQVSLALDSADYPHLAYTSNGNGERLRYAKKTTKGWEIEMPDTSTPDTTSIPYWAHSDPCLKINKLNRPCISYCRWGGNRELKYTTKGIIGWTIEKVDSANAGYENSLYLNTNNTPYISYEGNLWLKYAWKDSNDWQINKVDSMLGGPDRNLSCTSTAIDNNGYAHISYRGIVKSGGNDYGALKYAKGIGVGIEENNDNCLMLNAQLKAEPNPFVEKTVVSGSASGGFRSAQQEKEIKIQIYDIAGKLVEETKDNIIGKQLRTGIYFVKFKNYKPLKIVKLR